MKIRFMNLKIKLVRPFGGMSLSSFFPGFNFIIIGHDL